MRLLERRSTRPSSCRAELDAIASGGGTGLDMRTVRRASIFNDELRRHSKLAVFFDMKCSKPSFAVVSVLALLLSLSAGTLNARDADLASRTFAAAQTAKQKCINTCRARYRDCQSRKEVPSFECRGVYQDCTRFTCNAAPG